MPVIRDIVYEKMGIKKTKHYIETGIYRGDGIRNVEKHYENVHGIELSEKWYQFNVEQFKNESHIHFYLGDSKKVLPELLNTIQEPCTIFLDAHFSGKYTACGDEESPLLFELEILKNRPFDDIIIIDDCRLLGKAGQCGASIDHPIYPLMYYDWRDITEERIYNLMKKDYILLKNTRSELIEGPEDQFILMKKN